MRNYELTFIVHPDTDEEGLNAVVEGISRTIAANGGQVIKIDSWGKRRLAYPIRKCLEGHYMIMQLQLEPEAISELERNLKLAEEVIRYLIVRAD